MAAELAPLFASIKSQENQRVEGYASFGETIVQFDRHPVKIKKVPWYKQFEELGAFVCQHRRLPSAHKTSKPESRLYDWLWRQRSRISTGNLPEKFVAALQKAHPLISEAVAIAEPNSLNMRSDKELVK